MDMGSSVDAHQVVPARQDRSKHVGPVPGCLNLSEVTKIGIERDVITGSWMTILTVSVRLPDLDDGTVQRLAVESEHPTEEKENLPLGLPRRTNRQITAA